ncbi:hypothetical protein OG21DRAFT_1518544 [Imleria badia]|nr:hypothetical protein OG21DRAFT_1518544 [Imleria badia]
MLKFDPNNTGNGGKFDDHARIKFRTECWLEHSMFQERKCELRSRSHWHFSGASAIKFLPFF